MAISAGMALISTASAAISGTLMMGSLAAHFLITTALGAAINALTPKPSAVSAQTGYNVTTTSPVADHQIVYGMTKVAGVRVFDATNGSSNKYLHRVLAFTGHEISSFEEIYLNDEVVTLDGSGNVTSPSRYDGFVTIKVHLGADDQTADTALVSESVGWTSDHRLRGIAYLYVKFKFDQDVFPNGVPEIQAVIKGKKVYDPRTETTAWSDNPALCIRDYVLSTRYGLGESTDNVDDDSFIVAANVCDYYNYPTLTGDKRYTINGSFTTAASPYDLMQNMLSSMGGLAWYAQGKWRVKPAYWTAPSVLFTEDDLRSSISVSTRHSRRDNFNIVNGVWKGADSNWQPTDFPPVSNADFVTADNGQEKSTDLNLSFTSDVGMARRIANIYLERNRQQLTVQASFGMRAFQVQVGDNIRLSNNRFGWVQKEFEVVSWTFGLVDNNDLQVHMTLREISENVFDDISDGAVYERDNTTLLSPFEVPIPSLDAAVVTTKINNDGTAIPEIKFSWSVSDATIVDYYDFQWKLSTDSTWNSVSLEGTEFVLSPALSGRAYDYRVRAVNHLAVRSAFASSVSPASTGDDGTIPNAPSGLTATAGSETIKLSWTAPTQNTDSSTLKDLFQYKIYRNTVNNFGTATMIGRVAADIFTDGSLLGGQIYYYWVTALDYTGNESSQSTVTSATAQEIVSERSNGVFYIGVVTLPTTSSGAHTDFTNAIGDPVDRDQAWFYTGTLANPTAQSVWIYEEGSGATPADSWNYQENVMVGDLLVDGTITTDKIAAGAVGSIQIADDIQSDNYVANTSGWKVDKANGNAEFNDVLVRGTLSATVIDATEDFQFLTGQISGADCFAPLGAFDYAASAVSSANNATQVDSVVFYGPTGGTSGYNAKRVARYSAPSFLLEGEFNHYKGIGGTTLKLQVSVDGGAFTDVFSTANLLYGISDTGVQERIVYVYTTPASFSTLQFRAYGSLAARSYIKVTLNNWL